MLVEIAHLDVRRRVAGFRVGRGNICLKRTGLWHRGAADLIEARIPVTNVMSQSPAQVQVLAPRVFHLNRHATASSIFDVKYHSIQQALAAKVFNLDHHTIERVHAPKVVHLNRHDLASRIFHLNHHVTLDSFLHLNDFSAN
jgi:hypothetical protein